MSKDKDDEVGYGKPPKAHQFKPGQSGNPKGRPKGSRNLLKLISKHAAKKVAVIEGGVEKKMERMDVVISAMFNKASKGDVSAARLLTNLVLASSQLQGEEYDVGYTDEDLAVILGEADWQAQLVEMAKANE
ncbi:MULTISPECIES: DUF5681 domain-containing protein [unclassified Ruegeria]|uniref:DUF5681 domain-containing protein n=1 Tax=unclassified Ruegeria TaxID=2625375 RepID=UPI0014925656|nr:MULTISPECIES: DUF5681 domain-containing protein [unclassified Ruegeria]NOD36628.1 hypothetical protein [Ruegeria sp. HKCCD7296]NOE43873.1 hypothetical protein [Ruegeria sp. HKCCD7319]